MEDCEDILRRALRRLDWRSMYNSRAPSWQRVMTYMGVTYGGPEAELRLLPFQDRRRIYAEECPDVKAYPCPL